MGTRRGSVAVPSGLGVLAAGASLLAGCGLVEGSAPPAPTMVAPTAGPQGASTTQGTSDGTVGVGGAAATTTADTGTESTTSTSGGLETCDNSGEAPSKRLVRLTFHQLANSIETLFGETVAQQIRTDFEIDLEGRAAIPLASPREGSFFIESVWSRADAIASTTGDYVLANFAALSGCDTTDDACGEAYLLDVATQAFRRPLDADEQASVLNVYSEVKATEASVAESVQYGVYAVLSAPQFLYRTEFGAVPEQAGTLTPNEYANLISYFLTDAPPDAPLAELAQEGVAPVDAAWEAETQRLLDTNTARSNISAALWARFGFPMLRSIVIDPAAAPDFSEGLRNAMIEEGRRFLDHAWAMPEATDLLLSRQSFANDELAALYGIGFPPDGVTPDASGFAPVTLPEERAGILTMPGFLTPRSRPDVASVVGRGIMVMGQLACTEIPIFPEDLQVTVAEITEEVAALGAATEKEKAEHRAQFPECAHCHDLIDPFGLALERFDLIGQYRDVDSAGSPIDTGVTLNDGTPIADARQLAEHLVESGAFMRCLAQHWQAYALSEGGGPSADSCSIAQVMATFDDTPGALGDLLASVARSSTLYERAAPPTL